MERDTKGKIILSRRELITGAGVLGATSLLGAAEARAGGLQLVRAPSIDQQKQLGHKAAAQYKQKYKVVKDSRAKMFEDMGRRLIDALSDEDKSRWDYTFTVLETKEVNAFALPGGPMFLLTGLLAGIESEDALAGVTGHELTHVRHQHWARQVARSQERQLGLALILGATHANNQVVQLAGVANGVFGLKYSRGDEDDADKGGLQNLVDAGYNPNGIVDLFEFLTKGEGKSNLLGDALSDHPETKKRIETAKKRIADYEKARDGEPWPERTLLKK